MIGREMVCLGDGGWCVGPCGWISRTGCVTGVGCVGSVWYTVWIVWIVWIVCGTGVGECRIVWVGQFEILR